MLKRNLLLLFVAGTLLLSACNLPSAIADDPPQDPNAVFTAAAQTASVQLTQAAETAAVQQTSTPTPSLFLPTITPVATQAVTVVTTTVDDKCDKAKFVTDVTIPDGTEFTAGESFTKTWRVRNDGDCTWTADYALVFDTGERMGGASPQLLMGSIGPGDTVDLSVDLVAPNSIGTYTGNWQIRNNAGKLFAKVYVQIKVVDPSFAITSVKNVESFYIAGRGAALTAEVTASRAGNATYYWVIRESGQPDIKTASEQINYSASGTADVSTLWTGCPHSGNFTASLYIDTPNHQEFGSTSFKCP
jgi:hypothetical protein